MSKITMKKTVLALAVSFASMHAFAENATLDNDYFYTVNNQEFETMTFNGSYTGVEIGVDILDTVVSGNIVNNADIDSTNNAAFNLNGSQVGNPLSGLSDGASGNLINRGKVTATGVNVEALNLNYNYLGGDIVNEGTIEAIGTPNDSYQGPSAMRVEGSTIAGKIRNEGIMTATGDDSAALELVNNNLRGDEVVNTGKISVSGKDSIAIYMAQNQFGGKVINDGLITSDGFNSAAIYIDEGNTLYSIDNGSTGQIIATGEGSVGIQIDGSLFEKDIQNTGKISGEFAGIWIEDYDRPGTTAENSNVFDIHHEKGSIESDNHAILVSEGTEADLIWGDALIRGNLTNLAKIDVNGQAVFEGKTIQAFDGGLNIHDGASLSLSEPTTLIQGELELNNGAVIYATYSPALLDDETIIMVEGKAILAEGSKIAIQSTAADFAKGGRTFNVIKASELVDEGVVIVGGNAGFDFIQNVAANNTITVTAKTKSREDLTKVIASVGGNANSQKAGAEFYKAVESFAAANPNDPVVLALLAATDAESIAEIAKQLAPDVTGSATQAAAGGVTMSTSATGNRISAARSGMSSGYDMAGTGLWIQALGNDAEQDARSGIDGFKSDSKGFIIGADTKVDDFVTLGAYYSNVATDTKTDAGNKSESQTHMLGLYGSYQDGTFYVDGNLSAGRGNNDSKRFIAGTTAEGDFDSSILAASVMSGNSYEFEENMFIEPRVAVRYSNVKTDGFSENGSSASLNMGEQRIETGEVGLGARLSAQIGFHGGTLEPELSVMAYRDLIQDSAKTTASYVLGGNTFSVSGAANDKATYETSIGANYRRDNMTVGLSYNRMEKSSFFADGFAVKMRYDF